MSPRILVWDLENSPGLGWFYGSTYQTNIAKVEKPSRVMSFAAMWTDSLKIEYRSDFHDGHDTMVGRAWELLNEADGVVSWNGQGHDSPHINTEFLRAGAPLPSPYKEIDLYRVVRRKFKFHSNRLDFVSQELGIGQKLKNEGIDFWLACMNGDPKAWARFKKYNIEDVRLTFNHYHLYKSAIPKSMHPNWTLYVDGDACPKCGAVGQLQRRGHAPTVTALYPRFFCKSCGEWSQGKHAERRAEIRSAA